MERVSMVGSRDMHKVMLMKFNEQEDAMVDIVC